LRGSFVKIPLITDEVASEVDAAVARLCDLDKEEGELLCKHLTQGQCRDLPVEFIDDPAGSAMSRTREETAFDMLRQAGLQAVPAPTNDWEERTTALDMLLTKLVGGEPALQVHPRCKTLIRGLVGEYQFRRLQVTGDERYQDKPLTNDCSHVCEALHYALLGAGEGILPRKRQWSDSEVAEWRRWHETALPAHVFE